MIVEFGARTTADEICVLLVLFGTSDPLLGTGISRKDLIQDKAYIVICSDPDNSLEHQFVFDVIDGASIIIEHEPNLQCFGNTMPAAVNIFTKS